MGDFLLTLIKGEITYDVNEGSSFVNYIIASSNLFQFITDFEVSDRSESVHFPLCCSLEFDSEDVDRGRRPVSKT